nr:hypothetical protein JVH1_0615 [Rhodococcus sp. JVH1]
MLCTGALSRCVTRPPTVQANNEIAVFRAIVEELRTYGQTGRTFHRLSRARSSACRTNRAANARFSDLSTTLVCE